MNLSSPQDDLAFRLEYLHPYLDGVYNPRNRALRASCFNSRELSPVFTGGPGVDEVPAIRVDQAGLMANITDLKQVEEGAGKSTPPVLVIHGHYGGCIGDLPSYDTFTLGGPYSVRGYNMGELSAARNILEFGTEICVPVKNTHVYAFAGHGNDLGSSKDVKGSQTEVYRRMGRGSSYGVGVKLGLVRAEYAVDHNTGTGSVVHFKPVMMI